MEKISHFWVTNFKVKVDALPHLLIYGHETCCERFIFPDNSDKFKADMITLYENPYNINTN